MAPIRPGPMRSNDTQRARHFRQELREALRYQPPLPIPKMNAAAVAAQGNPDESEIDFMATPAVRRNARDGSERACDARGRCPRRDPGHSARPPQHSGALGAPDAGLSKVDPG